MEILKEGIEMIHYKLAPTPEHKLEILSEHKNQLPETLSLLYSFFDYSYLE